MYITYIIYIYIYIFALRVLTVDTVRSPSTAHAPPRAARHLASHLGTEKAQPDNVADDVVGG